MSKRILALWKRRSKKGQDYMSGILDLGAGGSANIVVFSSKNKKKDNSPDLYGILSEPRIAEENNGDEVIVEETAVA